MVEPNQESGAQQFWKREPGVVLLFDNASHKPNKSGMSEVAAALVSTLADSGWESRQINVSERGFAQSVDTVRDIRPDAIVAFGGDGTIAGCAELAVELDAALLAVPGGTMNLTTKDTGAFLDEKELVDRYLLGTEHRVDIAEINGRAFLHSIALGLVPSIGTHREAFRDRSSFVGRWTAAIDACRIALFKKRARITIETERGRASLKTLCAVVSNNRLAWHYDVFFGRSSIDRGELGVYVSMHNGPIGRVQLMLSLLTGQLERDPATRVVSAHDIEISAPVPSIMVSVDGEIVRMDTPLKITQKPRALRVIIPDQSERAKA